MVSEMHASDTEVIQSMEPMCLLQNTQPGHAIHERVRNTIPKAVENK